MTQTNLKSELSVTKEMLLEFLDPDFENGKLTWKPVTSDSLPGIKAKYLKMRNSRFAGKEAGHYCQINGYNSIRIFGRLFRAHRIIWFLAYGEWPQYIDHINGNRADNRITNLRNVTHTDNHRNMPLPKNNKTGVIGVRYDKKRKCYIAEITLNRKNKRIGSFSSLEDAARARAEYEKKHGFHPNHGRS